MTQHFPHNESHLTTQTLTDDFARLKFTQDMLRVGVTTLAPSREMEVDNPLLDELVDRYVGQSVHIEELPIARGLGQRAITRWESYNEQSLFAAPHGAEYANLRNHPQHPLRRYIAGEIFPHRRHTRGRIDGVDARHSSLVIRPLLSGPIFFTRMWAQVIDAQGMPLVNATFL